MKTRQPNEESHKAMSFLQKVVSDTNSLASATECFPPEAYRYDMGQVDILATLLHDLYEMQIQPINGMTVIEWHTLEAAGYAPGISAVELAKYWEYDKAKVSRAVQNLKDRGYLDTQPHPTDKRRLELRHTQSGRDAFLRQLATKNRYLDALGELISADEMRSFNDTTRKLIDHFRRVKQVSS